MDDAFILSDILKQEGGLVDDPADPGGITNFGITVETLTEYYGHPATPEMVKGLTADVAMQIYQSLYINRPGFGQIQNDTLRWLVVDTAVNNGRGRTIRWLQAAVNVPEDGIFGEQSLAAVNMYPKTAYYLLIQTRIVKYGELVEQNHVLVKFVAGWLKRAAAFITRRTS